MESQAEANKRGCAWGIIVALCTQKGLRMRLQHTFPEACRPRGERMTHYTAIRDMPYVVHVFIKSKYWYRDIAKGQDTSAKTQSRTPSSRVPRRSGLVFRSHTSMKKGKVSFSEAECLQRVESMLAADTGADTCNKPSSYCQEGHPRTPSETPS
jgi:hypothetical protein